MRYNPALDGLRAVAVALVVPAHCRVPGYLTGGYVGVELFFVLSGYLITTILLDERAATGRISLRHFYWRRALRLYPALLLMLAAYLLLAPMLWPEGEHGRDALLVGLYLSDYSYTFWKMPEYLGHTWSLAAEEHFYLLWPLVLTLLLRRRSSLVKPLGLLLLAAWLWQMHVRNVGTVGFRFDTRMVGMMAGCWLAVVLRSGWRPDPKIPAIVGLALLAWLVMTPSRSYFPLAESAGVLLIIGATAIPFLETPWLTYIGKLSYGIYLWHFPIAKALNPLPMGWLLTLMAVTAMSVALAALSHHTIEAFARRYRGNGARATSAVAT